MTPKMCLHCGLRLPGTTVFCPECGKPIEDAVRVEIHSGVGTQRSEYVQDNAVSIRRITGANTCLYCRIQLPDCAAFCPECGRPIERGNNIRPIQDCESDDLREKCKGDTNVLVIEGSTV